MMHIFLKKGNKTKINVWINTLPKTVSLQKYTKSQVILAIKLHCYNPVST